MYYGRAGQELYTISVGGWPRCEGCAKFPRIVTCLYAGMKVVARARGRRMSGFAGEKLCPEKLSLKFCPVILATEDFVCLLIKHVDFTYVMPVFCRPTGQNLLFPNVC